jgi:hypothetical protein
LPAWTFRADLRLVVERDVEPTFVRADVKDDLRVEVDEAAAAGTHSASGSQKRTATIRMAIFFPKVRSRPPQLDRVLTLPTNLALIVGN